MATVTNNLTSAGVKQTFWQLLNSKNISIPTLQRDYIYGVDSEKTNVVLKNLLDSFKIAVTESNKEVTLDFVYGSDSKAKEFMPLDGQQRLTTLFLLHYYAALMSDKTTEGDFDVLGKFSYATRNCTIAFCQNILINNHTQLRAHITSSSSSKNEHLIKDYLTDLDEFRGSFYTDPSVMSMINVLDKINMIFSDVNNLWDRLIDCTCPINFYILDFGVFDLSDDLYNKMNSRGKPLTNFEIFKAKLHKEIKKLDSALAESIAIKLDTSWTQFLWDHVSNKSDLKSVDPAFMQFFRNIFIFLDFLCGETKVLFNYNTDDCLLHNTKSLTRIKTIERIFDEFSSSFPVIPSSQLQSEFRQLIQSAINKDLTRGEILKFLAYFIGIIKLKAKIISNEDFEFNIRHLTNLIANSTNELRDDNMPKLLIDAQHIMVNQITTKPRRALNLNQWNEEIEKENHRAEWKKLFKYEDIFEINHTLDAFCNGFTHSNHLELGNPFEVSAITNRLEKAEYFFSTIRNEIERKAILLSIDDYSMADSKCSNFLYFGVVGASWQNFTSHKKYRDKIKFMDVLDKISIGSPLSSNYSSVAIENWRYYAIKYIKHIIVAYHAQDYGYMYFYDQNTKNNNIDVVILQSTYYGDSNVAWKMLNRIVEKSYSDKYHMYLDPHHGSPIILNKINPNAQITINGDGWHLKGVSSADLSKVGISHTVITAGKAAVLDSNNNIISPEVIEEVLLVHDIGQDYIEECEDCLDRLASIYANLKM